MSLYKHQQKEMYGLRQSVSPTLSHHQYQYQIVGAEQVANSEEETINIEIDMVSANDVSLYNACQNGLVEEVDKLYVGLEEVTSTLRKTNHVMKHLTEVEHLSLPDIIKQKSEEIYQRNGAPTNRGKKRKYLIFNCVYQAYRETCIPVDPKQLAKEIGIPVNKISKALKMSVKPILARQQEVQRQQQQQTGAGAAGIPGAQQEFQQMYRYPLQPLPQNQQTVDDISIIISNQKYFTPLDFIDKYWSDTGLLDDSKEDAKIMFTGLLNKDSNLKDSDLNEYQAPPVALAFLIYYAKINGINLPDDFYIKVNRTFTSLQPIVNKITEIDNS